MSGVLTDRFGRVARDLRISVTDKCNLRCTYCMPAEGLAWRKSDELLTTGEIARVVRVGVALGIESIRLTGGEPLVRPDLELIVAAIAAHPVDLALTTNAVGLAARAQALKDAGLQRINISLDAVDREVFAQVTRRDRLNDVLAGIDAAEAAGLTPLKINAVITRGVNESQIVPLARFALDRGFQLRFIEEMPLGPAGRWDLGEIVSQAEIHAELARHFDLGDHLERGSDPASVRRFGVGVTRGLVGVIPTVTEPFCGACDRTRLTADGRIMNCLFARAGVSLRDAMRAGADDDDLALLWQGEQWRKGASHGIGQAGFVKPELTMSQIGG